MVFFIKLCYQCFDELCFALLCFEKYLLSMNDCPYFVYQALSCFDDLLGKSLVPGDYNATAHLVLKVPCAGGL